ncbi:hypothetical protein KNU14_gp63 [Gordonia phage Buggaboo]|uniref:Uncharacterized protein n=1 Tax=Gordonia phage Buggaboo TaxID=2315529 RepID=A0A386KCE7_9CAUD|nr:hypothetical protein KNU14_gp63 [Gordonia phage Buggaboo]AYD83255.1 hypothetical protein SEA_BUGGABOO_63 [Gordonia phage Buggaboo]
MTIVNRVPTLRPTPMCQATHHVKTRIAPATLVCRLKAGHPEPHWWIAPRALPAWKRMPAKDQLRVKERTELMDRAIRNRQSRSAQLMQELAEDLRRMG